MKRQIIILSICSMVMLIIFKLTPSSATTAIPIQIERKEIEQESEQFEHHQEIQLMEETLMVDLKGEVRMPGVYEVKINTRIYEVIELAGGFTSYADQKQINLAQHIKDEMVIYVPHVEEEMASINFMTGYDSQKNQKISLNKATVDQLQALPGIGQSKATAIIQYRTENGRFKSIDELVNVSGIGAKTLESIRDLIEL